MTEVLMARLDDLTTDLTTVVGDVTFTGITPNFTSIIGATRVHNSMLNADVFSTTQTWSALATFSAGVGITGGATVDTINKLTLTQPATGATLTIANGKTLTASNTLTFAGTDGKSLTLTNSLTVNGNDGTITFGGLSKTLTVNNSLTLAGTDGTTMTFPGTSDTVVTLTAAQTLTNKTLTTPVIAQIVNTGTLTLPTSTDTLVGRATTDTLTNKTLDTAGAGNIFKINGTQISAVTGTGAVVLASSPTITTPFIATIYGGSVAASTLTLQSTNNASPSGDSVSVLSSTINLSQVVGVAKTINLGGGGGTGGVTVNIGGASDGVAAFNVYTGAGAKQTWVSGGGNTTITFPGASDTLVGRATTDTLTNKTLNSPVISSATFSSSFLWQGVISPAALSANTNNWAPTGLSSASIVRMSSSGAINITGLLALSTGYVVSLMNVGSNTITLTNLDANSTAANQFNLGSNTAIGAGQSILLWYDATSSNWRAVAGAGSGGGGGVTSLGGQTGAISLTGPLQVSGGVLSIGGTFTSHGVLVSQGTGNLTNTGTGTTGQALVSNGASADPSFQGGMWVLLNTLTASNSASLSDTTSFATAGYNDFELVFENVIAGTASVTGELLVHSGGSFQTTGYLSSGFINNGTGIVTANSTTAILLTNAVSQTAGAPGLSGSVKFYGPLSVSGLHPTRADMVYAGGNGIWINAGTWNTSAVIDGFEFFYSSGNITSGTIKVYGRK